ncbi:hypothetical protein Scep_015427 [Stephania cephalantha]|uniref:Pectate lyase n=1 Tax=Stephania cephalantha TaxID=152367 RepID=A0AAP0P3W9_9MAGN
MLSILITLSLLIPSTTPQSHPNLTLPHQHPDPDSVARHLQRRVSASIIKRRGAVESQCLTGNPIDDCWRCDPNWRSNRQALADCGLGFGRDAMGGKGGPYYVVTDPTDLDPVTPRPGTLRHAVIQTQPLWIVFESSMVIRLNEELIVNSFKTIDGRGASVHVTGGGCITLQFVSNVIIHNLHIHHCVPSGNANVRSSPTHYGYRTRSDGDGISIYSSRKIWIDHCDLSYCTDGLIDAIMGSTGITISNSYFSHHNEVMLLGHNDNYVADSGMQVTIAFNHFGEGCVQRMPRCRHGYFHVVNNDFTHWEMYAIGGSASPTINSQGNRYTAPMDPYAKEVTKRVETDEREWTRWNWRTEGDMMVNGAFFVPSGFGVDLQYAKASSLDPHSSYLIDQLTMYSGVLLETRENNLGVLLPGPNNNAGAGISNSGTGTVVPVAGQGRDSNGRDRGGDGDVGIFGMVFGNAAPPLSPHSIISSSLMILCTILISYFTSINGPPLLILLLPS